MKKYHCDGDILEHSFGLKDWNYAQRYLNHSSKISQSQWCDVFVSLLMKHWMPVKNSVTFFFQTKKKKKLVFPITSGKVFQMPPNFDGLWRTSRKFQRTNYFCYLDNIWGLHGHFVHLGKMSSSECQNNGMKQKSIRKCS